MRPFLGVMERAGGRGLLVRLGEMVRVRSAGFIVVKRVLSRVVHGM